MDCDAEIAIPIVFFICITIMIVVPIVISSVNRNRERTRLHETMRVMVEKGQPVSPEFLQSLTPPATTRPPSNDLRRGVVLLAIGLGLAGLGLALGVDFFVGVAAFPGFLGVGFIGLGLWGPSRFKV